MRHFEPLDQNIKSQDTTLKTMVSIKLLHTITTCLFAAFIFAACQEPSQPVSTEQAPTTTNPKATAPKPAIPDTAKTSILLNGVAKNKIPDSTLVKTEGTLPPEVAGVYEATFPCNDCAGVYHELTLQTNGTYQLVETYQATKKGNETNLSNGTWKALRRKLVLQDTKYRKVIRYYAVVDKDKLEMLSMNGDLLYARSPEIFQLKRKSE